MLRFIVSLAAISSLFVRANASTGACRTMAGDLTWPSPSTWQAFNTSVGGRLVATVPLASVCHSPHYNATACAVVQANWNVAEFHEPSSSSMMSAVYSNFSCSPFSGVGGQCIRGNYIAYAVNASSQADILATIAFAKTHNIRFVVRNSGHDYLGKSTGAGGLAVWTHYLQKVTWSNYRSSFYTGLAITAQAGVSSLQMYEEASAHNVTVIAGHCPSVGYTGGYVQGGGHGPLSSLYGLAADDVLEFQVITTTGQILTASPTQNLDLFWALRGGGGGTYGIVWSVTSRIHPPVPVTGAIVTFAAGGNVSLDTFWAGVAAYRAQVPAFTAAGGMASTVYESGLFELYPLFLPNGTVTGINNLLSPFLSTLKQLHIPYNLTVLSYPNFLSAYQALSNTAIFAVQNTQQGSRLLPKSLWSSPKSLATLDSTIRTIVDNGAGAFDMAVAPRSSWNHPANAVLPAWRDATTSLVVFELWNQTGTPAQARAQQQLITNVYVESLKTLTPGSGSYLNEADGFDPDWKTSFYGQNYIPLLLIKDKYDPSQMLYGATAVGGDRWAEQPDGHLCRVY